MLLLCNFFIIENLTTIYAFWRVVSDCSLRQYFHGSRLGIAKASWQNQKGHYKGLKNNRATFREKLTRKTKADFLWNYPKLERRSFKSRTQVFWSNFSLILAWKNQTSVALTDCRWKIKIRAAEESKSIAWGKDSFWKFGGESICDL